jgi:hypothetical protein
VVHFEPESAEQARQTLKHGPTGQDIGAESTRLTLEEPKAAGARRSSYRTHALRAVSEAAPQPELETSRKDIPLSNLFVTMLHRLGVETRLGSALECIQSPEIEGVDDHTLTSRVAMNHLWMRHFHSPLVASMYDFGRNWARPARDCAPPAWTGQSPS